MGHGVRIPRRSSWVILATLYLVASWSVNIMANSGFDSDDLQCPEVCSCIEQPYEGLETECTNVQNKELLRKALTGLPNKTRTLILAGNNLSSILNSSLSEMTRLTMLSLANNNFENISEVIAAIPDNVRRTLLNLKLPGNQLANLKRSVFSDFLVLQHLKLPGNQLANLKRSVFSDFLVLQHLDLSNNGITDLPDGVFSMLPELLSVKLNGNAISHLSPGVFPNASKLQTLELESNKLTSLTNEMVENIGNLELLDLSKNSLSTIEVGAFSNLKRLKELRLSSNNLGSSISKQPIFQNMSIKILNLDDNNIIEFHGDIFKGTKFPNLGGGTLNLNMNRIDVYPWRAIQQLENLEYLFLDGNLIQILPNQFSNSTSLKYVYLSGNLINTIEPYSLDNLKTLDILSLDNNQIESLPGSLAVKIQKIILGGNPLKCDCKLIWFVRWLQTQSLDDHDIQSLKCHLPVEMLGQLLMNLTLERMLCGSKEPVSCPLTANSECKRLCNGLTPCFVCPEGSYGKPSQSKNETICQSCAAFSTSKSGSVSPEECHCMAGYEEHEGICIECPPNFSKSSIGPGKCEKCQNFQMTILNASTQCYCEPGYYLDNNSECKACPVSTFKEEVGPSSCNPCQEGATSPEGSSSRSSCTCLHGEEIDFFITGPAKCKQKEEQRDLPFAYSVAINTPEAENAITEEKDVHLQADQMDHSVGLIIGLVTGLVGVVAVSMLLILVVLKRQRQLKAKVEKNDLYDDEASQPALSFQEPSMDKKVYAEWEVPKKNLKIGHLLGQGAFGKVYEAWAEGIENGGKPVKVAVKTFRDNASPEEIEALKTELDQMIYVGHHPNVINLLGACTYGNNTLMIIMEYASMGNLLNYLKTKALQEGYQRQKQNGVADKDILSFAWQIAKGMSHLEALKCIHRDLAARNILISDGMVAKVSDFGLAREAYESGYYFKESKGRLPFRWMSPESLLSGQYTTKSDVWSYGIVLWEMATLGGTPYPGIPPDRMYELLKSGYRMSNPDCSQDIYTLMLHCWQELPSDRPTFKELANKFDKILQQAANNEYLDIEPEESDLVEYDNGELDFDFDIIDPSSQMIEGSTHGKDTRQQMNCDVSDDSGSFV